MISTMRLQLILIQKNTKMKKWLLLLLAAQFSLSAKSNTSVYHPFPETTATWLTDIYYNTCMGYCGSVFYQMKGDTSINSISYNKIYSRSGQFSYTIFPAVGATFSACSYVGAIRQDSSAKKVYFIDSTMTSETLLYDFNLSIGDTVQGWYNKLNMPPLVLSEIDSIAINGNYHKRFNFQNTNGTSLIEGVGWSGELFGCNVTSALWTALACFNGTVIIQEAFINESAVSLDCSIALAVSELNRDKDVSLFPNPFADKLTFTSTSNELFEITIYDLASRKLLQQQFVNSGTLNCSQLTKGIYLYEVRNRYGLCAKGKVVKN